MAITKKELLLEDNKYRQIAKYIYVRNKKIYAIKWSKGKTYKQVAPMQDVLAINERGEPTKALKDWIANWVSRINNKDYIESLDATSRVPTFKEVIRYYKQIAEVEYQVTKRPAPETVKNVIYAIIRLLAYLNLTEDSKVNELKGSHVESWIYQTVGNGEIKAVSAYSTLKTALSLFSKWARRRYVNDMKWDIPSYSDMPKARGNATGVDAYSRPDDDLRQRTINTWNAMETLQPKTWVAMTMMIAFAMRNGDVRSLKWKQFMNINGQWTLVYTPSKTSVSARGRQVHWPLTTAMYERLRAAGDKGEYVLDNAKNILDGLNAIMRGIGWNGSKASYELRKMCIDQVYRTMGLERAIQISGDDSKTLQRYYADPSRVSFTPPENLY